MYAYGAGAQPSKLPPAGLASFMRLLSGELAINDVLTTTMTKTTTMTTTTTTDKTRQIFGRDNGIATMRGTRVLLLLYNIYMVFGAVFSWNGSRARKPLHKGKFDFNIRT
jgi:hypothetical protein